MKVTATLYMTVNKHAEESQSTDNRADKKGKNVHF